jgi:hypothetical protein
LPDSQIKHKLFTERKKFELKKFESSPTKPIKPQVKKTTAPVTRKVSTSPSPPKIKKLNKDI